MGNSLFPKPPIDRDFCIKNRLFPLADAITCDKFIRKNRPILAVLNHHEIGIQMADHIIMEKTQFVQLILPKGYYFAVDVNNAFMYYVFSNSDEMLFSIEIKIRSLKNIAYIFTDNTNNVYTDKFCRCKNAIRVVICVDIDNSISINELEQSYDNFIIEKFYDEIFI